MKNSDDETILAHETDYVWNPEWSHPLFINVPTDISSKTITTVSINRDYVRITLLIIDATLLNYNSLFTDRTGNNSLNSTIFNTQDRFNIKWNKKSYTTRNSKATTFPK